MYFQSNISMKRGISHQKLIHREKVTVTIKIGNEKHIF